MSPAWLGAISLLALFLVVISEKKANRSLTLILYGAAIVFSLATIVSLVMQHA